jgi:glycosyltransferase involved in cell wall biosynthesis
MNILFVHENRGFRGGVEQYICDVASGFSSRGHRSELLYSTETSKMSEVFDRSFASLIKEPALATGSDALRARICDPQYDLIFIHKVPVLAPFLVEGRRPLVRMVHDHDVTCPRRHRYDAYTHQVCNRPATWLCALDLGFVERDPDRLLGLRFKSPGAFFADLASHRLLDGLVVASRYMRQTFAINGIDEQRIHIAPPPVKGAPHASPVPAAPHLLYVGQLIRGKGIDQLLKAFVHLPDRCRLDIVGDGNARESLEAVVRAAGLAERVRFRGWVGHEQLGTLYTESRVVVVPSRWPEPYGMVGIEAMTHGRAVVGFAVGGIPDWLKTGVTGLAVEAGDIRGLAAALTDVLAPGRAEALGAAGRRTYDEELSFMRIIDRLLEIMQQVAHVYALKKKP